MSYRSQQGDYTRKEGGAVQEPYNHAKAHKLINRPLSIYKRFLGKMRRPSLRCILLFRSTPTGLLLVVPFIWLCILAHNPAKFARRAHCCGPDGAFQVNGHTSCTSSSYQLTCTDEYYQSNWGNRVKTFVGVLSGIVQLWNSLFVGVCSGIILSYFRDSYLQGIGRARDASLAYLFETLEALN